MLLAIAFVSHRAPAPAPAAAHAAAKKKTSGFCHFNQFPSGMRTITSCALVSGIAAAVDATEGDMYRATPAMGGRGYGSMRLSIISSSGSVQSTADESFYTYDEPFKYRW